MFRRLRPSSVLMFAVVMAIATQPRTAAAVSAPVYVSQWGSGGGGSGQFVQPGSIATDGAGFVYVADTGNNRVQKFTTAGAFVAQWGTSGGGNGQFSSPSGIAVAGGKVYVVDTGNTRVQVFTTAGAYVSQWGTAGTGNGQFQTPMCVAVDGGGDVFVTDFTLNRVQRFTSAGGYLTQWGSTGIGPDQYSGMAGICLDAFGFIYIVDSGNNYVQVYHPTGTWGGEWGGFGAAAGQFNAPFGICSDGVYVYVVDTGNNRMQILTNVGVPLAQWNSGAGTFSLPRAAAIDGSFTYVADTQRHRIVKFGTPPSEECAVCLSPPDTCCEANPQVGGPWTNILVGTRQPTPWTSNPYCVTIFDLNSNPLPAEDANWASMTRYNGPGVGWVGDSLGTVFGLTLDEYGNIFVTHSSAYNNDLLGQVFGGGPGAVYRLDAVTGKITTFCTLPNFVDTSVQSGEDYPGLGNITYDCRHKQFFVTNIEDGRIYRIQPVGVNGTTGTVVETFDPLTPDNGLAGWAPIGERLWGIQCHGDRVYYSVWAQDQTEGTGPNEIRSVGLAPAGAFATGTDQHELFLPPLPGDVYSNPVADISFSANGKMLLGERGISGKTYPLPHVARVLEYACSGGCWLPANHYLIGDCCSKTNAEGGVDYDRQPFSGPSGALGRVWATGDALHLGTPYPDVVYGYQGLRPNLAFGSNLNSMLVDSDGQVADADKTYVGDVEAPGCPPVLTGAICGQKYNDLNHNGAKDGGEPGVPGWTIQLNGPGGPYTATTDLNGNYCFTNLTPGSYTVSELGVWPWIQMAPAGGAYTVGLSAGQTLYAQDFGNYACNAVGGGCVSPPPMMAAWWPFNENLGSTTASDATHLSPARNVAQLFGGAAIGNGGEVGRALCLSSELDYATVPNANQLGVNFGSGPFAIDAWVNPAAGAGGIRPIVEKRRLISPSPYRTLGWALYLNGSQCFLEIGIGVSTQVIPGPTLTPGAWSHIAVSVDRTPAAGQWYLNGAPQTALAFVPAPGPVSCTADLTMGQVCPGFPASSGFRGCIDEVELFNSAGSSTPILPAATVAAIYSAGGNGKCPEYVLMPQVTTICKTQTSVQACFNICNNSATPRSYHWSLAGMPVGPGCSVAGPVTFTPPAGSITVAAGSCSAPICVTIPRPAGLTTQNATSCYALSIVNDATGNCMTRTGTIRADYTCWCVTPPAGVTGARVATGTPIVIGVGHPCDPVAIPYRLVPVWLNSDHADPLELSLNGLPPGEPVLGTLSLTPGGGDPQLTVSASYPNGYDSSAPYEIAIEADIDGSGVMQRIGGALVMSTYDSSQTVAVAPAPITVADVRLVVAPNPFLGGSTVNFALARPDDIDLAVYDLGGRAVRVLQHGRLAEGAHRFEWNGRDDRGRKAPAGVYFVRFDATGRHVESKLVKLQ